jgi:hypothetical protein
MENSNFNNFIQKNKTGVAIYLCWVLLHFILMFSNAGFNKNGYFFPFNNDNIWCYDYSEFLVYTVSPLFVFLIFKLLNQEQNKTDSE